ncbi:photosystem I reaction center subunit PsaK [Aerosakkonemataceae cyanobacterium BLCC-F154]|uniref:Photosystem I reaction center subunit PsaK n=1 Tax=Floridaenema fluviatile BLCC-F154 TaxID=3153640 RepID=A0ABV4YBY6_9CYAN
MIHSLLLAAQVLNVRSENWSLQIGAIMIVCNILALLIVRYATQDRGSKPASPVPGFGLPQLIAGACFGHILGAGVILGLTNSGVL